VKKLILISFLLISIISVAQRTKFENNVAILITLDTKELNTESLIIFSDHGADTLLKLKINLFQYPEDFFTFSLDSIQVKVANKLITIPGKSIRFYTQNSVIHMSFQEGLDYDCIESWIAKNACQADVDEPVGSCEKKLIISSIQNNCLTILRKKVVIDCELKQYKRQ